MAHLNPESWQAFAGQDSSKMLNLLFIYFLRLLIFLGDWSNTIDKLTTQKHVNITVTKRYTKYLLNIYVSPPHRIVYNERGLNVLSLKLENIDMVLPMPRMAQLNKEPFPSDTMHVN